MKLPALTTVISATAIALTATVTVQLPSLAIDPVNPPPPVSRFYCDQSGIFPVTKVRIERGVIPVIRWQSDFGGRVGYTPWRRCVEVSGRFNKFYQEGTLNYLTTGVVNNQPVICVAKQDGAPCAGILFTLNLENRRDASRVLQQIFDIRDKAAAPLNESASSRLYIDMQEFLKTAPVESSATDRQPKVRSSAPLPHPENRAERLW